MTDFPHVNLGTGLEVSALGFGGMALTSMYGESDPDQALKTLHHAVDLGIDFIDTADVYGLGTNEELIGRLLADRRDEVTVATKFGIDTSGTEPGRRSRGDRAYVRQCIDNSLRRLDVDVVDLYYLHRVDPHIPIEETIGAMAELIADGKVRYIGVSEVTAPELERAHRAHPLAAVQSEWSLFSRDVENAIVPTAARLGIGFVPYSPLGRGMLTGTVKQEELGDNDFRRYLPRFQLDAFATNTDALAPLTDIASQHGSTPAQIALAWLRAKGTQFALPVVPIPGTRNADRVTENASSVHIELTTDQLAVLDTLADAVTGTRAPDMSRVSAGRE